MEEAQSSEQKAKSNKMLVLSVPGCPWRGGQPPQDRTRPRLAFVVARLEWGGLLTFSLLCGLGWLAYEVVSYTALARRTNRRIVERKNSDT